MLPPPNGNWRLRLRQLPKGDTMKALLKASCFSIGLLLGIVAALVVPPVFVVTACIAVVVLAFVKGLNL